VLVNSDVGKRDSEGRRKERDFLKGSASRSAELDSEFDEAIGRDRIRLPATTVC